MDPVTHYYQSPYNGLDNNPVFWCDPSGADVFVGTNQLYFDGADAGAFIGALITAMNGGVGEYVIQGDVYDIVDMPEVEISHKTYYTSSGLESSGGGVLGIIQNHTYENSPYYQYVRDEMNAERWNDFAQTLQDIGDGIALAGYGLTLTGVGAEIGIPLAAIGNGMSTAGSIVEIVSTAVYTDNYGKSFSGAGFTIAGEILPNMIVKKIPGLEYLGEKILKQNLELKLIGIERFINYQMQKEK